ncbi:MAG: hypothetical protein Q8R40_04140 [bacterium]|nr:hypothetical protein [bacterium]
MKYFTAVIIFFCLFVRLVDGHGSGQSLEQTVGEYMVDVGYDTSVLTAGEPVRFDFNLRKKENFDLPEFTDVWVRIAPQEQGILFAGNIHFADFGPTGMTIVFPAPGSYQLTVRFQKDDEKIAEEVSFPLTVERGESSAGSASSYLALIGTGITGLLAGFVASYLIWGKKSQ